MRTVALAHQDHREVSLAFCGFATRAACAAKGRAPVSAQCFSALCRLLLRGPEGNLALVTALEEVVAVHMAREANLQASNLTGSAQSACVTVVSQDCIHFTALQPPPPPHRLVCCIDVQTPCSPSTQDYSPAR